MLNQEECQSCHDPQTKVLGSIAVTLDTTLRDTHIREETLLIAILGGLCFLLIAGTVALMLRKTVLNPLSLLVKSAEALSRGDYSVRARSNQHDETGVLASTFNEMASKVEQRNRELELSRQELAAWNRDLEGKIAQRTRELSTLNAVISAVSASLNLNKILNVALDKVLEIMDIDGGAIHLRNERSKLLVIMVHRELRAANLPE